MAEMTSPECSVDGPRSWLRAPAKAFEGDVAVRELRTRLALNPRLVPEPPEPSSRISALKRMAWLTSITAVTVGAAYLTVLFGFPDEKGSSLARDDATPVTLSVKNDQFRKLAQVAPVRFTPLESRRVRVNEVVPLGLELTRPLGEGVVIVSGLTLGARLSTGVALAKDSWRVPISELAQAQITPPLDFVGVMELAVELRAADGSSLDRNLTRIEWVPVDAGPSEPGPSEPVPVVASLGQQFAAVPPLVRSAQTMLDPEDVAILIKRGQSFIANGDLASARLVLRRAADGGDPKAADLLGLTYDPTLFKQLGVIGPAPDLAQARAWYQRAAVFGSANAARGFERCPYTPRLWCGPSWQRD
jgi:hypothetical protein